jgi:hypothetical protein
MKNLATSRTRTEARLSEPILLSLKEASERSGLNIWKIRHLIWDGKLEVFQYPNGRKYYVRADQLQGFIEENTRALI